MDCVYDGNVSKTQELIIRILTGTISSKNYLDVHREILLHFLWNSWIQSMNVHCLNYLGVC